MLSPLFIRIGPVVDRCFREFIICKRFKRRTGKVERKFPFDMIKCHIRLICIYALMSLIDDQHIPVNMGHFLQLLMLTAELDRAL